MAHTRAVSALFMLVCLQAYTQEGITKHFLEFMWACVRGQHLQVHIIKHLQELTIKHLPEHFKDPHSLDLSKDPHSLDPIIKRLPGLTIKHLAEYSMD